MNQEITLAVAELKEALPGLKKIITNSRTLPVLQTVRINRNPEGIVTLHATDLDSHLTYITREPQQGQPEDILVPVDQLVKAVKCSAPKEEIGLVLEGKDKLKLRYNIAGNRVEQTISTLAVEDYPPVPLVKQPGSQLEPGFGQALREALSCRSEDASRYVLQGACLDVNDKKFHYIVGTNGRMLFSANSFCFDLKKSVIIPDSKFLTWSDFLDEQPALISVEPGQEAQPAKDGKPAVEATAGWVKLESPRWTYITREIDGNYPNWKQVIPTTTDGKWTQVVLSDEAVKQLIQVIPNLPGADGINSGIRLQVDRCLTIEGKGKDDAEWTSVPVQTVNVTGEPVAIGLNREYLLKGLRFGLNKLEIATPLDAMVMSKGGKKMVIMPLRLEEAKVEITPVAEETNPETTTATTTDQTQIQPPGNPEAKTEERTEPMPKKNTTTEPGLSLKPKADEDGTKETTTTAKETTKEPETSTQANNGNGTSAVKSLIEQVDQIKDTLRSAIRDLVSLVDTVKAAEKEKKATEKEIEAVRAKLRQIQNVSL